MELLKYMLLSGASLFVIIDPIATVPAFLAMTPNDGPEARIRMARLACIIAAAILIIFVLSRNDSVEKEAHHLVRLCLC